MIRFATTGIILAGSVLLVGCATSMWTPRTGPPVENTEINRGAQNKSSPDSGQSPAGDGLGGRGSER